MPCAEKLLKNGNSPNGNQLLAKFDKNTAPAQVKVLINGVDQNDVADVNPAGVWTSINKYTATSVTLVLLDANGNEIQRCNYNNDGTPVAKSVRISSFEATYTGGEYAQLSWNILEQVNVAAYVVRRYYDGSLDKTLVFYANATIGVRTERDLNPLDDISNLSLYEYRIFASFSDGVLSEELARITLG